jgi:hypothetical protein
MNEIDYFKVFVFCSGNMITDVDHLHVKKIYLVSFSYIVIENKDVLTVSFTKSKAQINKDFA